MTATDTPATPTTAARPTGPRRMPAWAKALLWTLGGLALAVLLYVHLTSGGGPGRHG